MLQTEAFAGAREINLAGRGVRCHISPVAVMKPHAVSKCANPAWVLADFTGAHFSRDAVTRIKEVATMDRPFVKRAARVHTETMPNVFYDAIKIFSQRELPTFGTREDALEFLVRN